MQLPRKRLASLWQLPGVGGILLFALVACKPSYDSILKDVERNYASTGFLDPDTFQIKCPLAEGGDRLALCREQLTAGLVAYKERYDREAYARRNHADFQPFLTHTPVTDAARSAWAAFYADLGSRHSRLVWEKRSGEKIEGIFRLRLPDLIYRVQKAS